MKIDKVHIKSRFKNLEDFLFEFDPTSMETVLLGLNATGKSNFMEALVIIFRDLDLEVAPKLQKKDQTIEYYIKYNCRGRNIEIEYSIKGGYSFIIDNDKLRSRSQFFSHKNEYLPSHVFIYYSGLSERLKSLYAEHKLLQFKKMMTTGVKYKDFNEMPRIFLVEPIHASFALIAFYLFDDREKETIKFLKKELNIIDFGSALFMLKQPNWSKSRKGDERFWHTDGLVRRFIEDLWNFSIAPMFIRESIKGSLNKRETLNRLYLFLKDKETIRLFVDMKYKNKITLFNALCSLHYSELVEDQDVRIKVIKENILGELAMGELSEGEKQLITVLGLLKFTKDDEALILLDEPDTHLNPLWKWKYLDFLNDVVHKSEKTQIVFCTHDPLVIGSMDKKQVKIFIKDIDTGETSTITPLISPKEMSVSKILTSELFGIPSLISKEVEDKLNEKRYLQTKIIKGKISKKEKTRFEELKEYLDSIGFYDISIDSRYNKYLQLTSENHDFVDRNYTKAEEDELDRISRDVMKEILKSEKEGSV